MEQNLTPQLRQNNDLVTLATYEGRQALLAACGLDVEKAGAKLQKLITHAETLLNAARVSYFSYQGNVIDTRTDADYAIQLRAAEFLRDTLVELLTPKREEAKISTDVTVTVKWD